MRKQVLLAISLILAGANAGAADTVTLVRNVAGKPLANVPVTFGQVFRRCEIPKGRTAVCLADGRPAQVDAKRHYDDGSLRFAVVSAMLPQLPADGAAKLSFKAGSTPASYGAIKPADLLKSGFDAVVTFRFPDGAVRSISARKLLERDGERARTWLRGPVATEWLLAGAPNDRDGKPDDDLRVQFQVRAYSGVKRTRVSVVVESCGDQWAGNIRYDASVTVGGKSVYTARAVDHRPLSRWRKVFWWGEPDDSVMVVHDLAALSATGALPNYDRTLSLPDAARTPEMRGPRWEIMGHGSLVAAMGTTGGRDEIGPYPTWTARYLLTMAPQAKALVLAQGDLAGSWPIHVRVRKTDRVLTLDERPDFWLDSRGQDRPVWKPARHEPDPSQDKLEPDLAHQPSLAYVPYLVTGDYYYLEEAYFWASYCLLNVWPAPRQGGKGIVADQIRGEAWALRNIADAAWIACDGDPEKGYFESRIRANIADRTARMIGLPEHSKLGSWGEWTVEESRIQNAANPRWLITAPWEEDYLLWSFHHLVELGYPEAAKPRDYLLRMRVGVLTHLADYDPMLGTPYRLAVGERSVDGRNTFYEDWKTMGRENARLSKPDLPNYGNSYAYSARATVICGIDGGFPGAPEAPRWLDDHLADHRRVMAENPVWAFAVRGEGAK